MPQDKRDPSTHLPLTPAVFHILLALSEGDKHGYGIMQEVANRAGGLLRIGPGTLYRSIERMVGDGLIEEADAVRDDPDKERRRYYRLSPFGRAVAKAEAQRLAGIVRLAEVRKLIPKPRTS